MGKFALAQKCALQYWLSPFASFHSGSKPSFTLLLGFTFKLVSAGKGVKVQAGYFNASLENTPAYMLPCNYLPMRCAHSIPDHIPLHYACGDPNLGHVLAPATAIPTKSKSRCCMAKLNLWGLYVHVI